jgi:hypothetical protein
MCINSNRSLTLLLTHAHNLWTIAIYQVHAMVVRSSQLDSVARRVGRLPPFSENIRTQVEQGVPDRHAIRAGSSNEERLQHVGLHLLCPDIQQQYAPRWETYPVSIASPATQNGSTPQSSHTAGSQKRAASYSQRAHKLRIVPLVVLAKIVREVVSLAVRLRLPWWEEAARDGAAAHAGPRVHAARHRPLPMRSRRELHGRPGRTVSWALVKRSILGLPCSGDQCKATLNFASTVTVLATRRAGVVPLSCKSC